MDRHSGGLSRSTTSRANAGHTALDRSLQPTCFSAASLYDCSSGALSIPWKNRKTVRIQNSDVVQTVEP